MARLFAALRSAVYASAFFALWVWLSLSVRTVDGTIGFALPGGARIVGGILMVLGAVVALACVTSLVVRGHGTPAPFDPPREFVTTGPYRWVRNPMYLGGLAIMIGFGLWHRSVSMTGVGLLFGLAAHVFVLIYEEPDLASRFGDGYTRYKSSVPRWIPRRPRS